MHKIETFVSLGYIIITHGWDIISPRMVEPRQCLVCLNVSPQLYSICQCRHCYCLECCQNHIKSSIASFNEIKCLSENCDRAFKEQSYPFATLEAVHVNGYKKYKRQKYFQQNTHLKTCKKENCEGEFSIKIEGSPKCNACQTQHCAKCHDIQHQGPCDQSHEEGMRKLGYRKCGNCSIFVDKIEGCNYISCKCGSVFCYTCGVDWVNDPCRFQIFQVQNQAIKTSLAEFRFKPVTLKSFPRAFAVGILQIFVIPFIIIIASLILPLLVILLLLIATIILSPILVMVIIVTSTCNHCIKASFVILTIILYPAISVFAPLCIIIFLMLYPCTRNNFNYHHGIFDPFQQFFLKYVYSVLNILVCVIQL